MKLDMRREEEASFYNGQFFSYKFISNEGEQGKDLLKLMHR